MRVCVERGPGRAPVEPVRPVGDELAQVTGIGVGRRGEQGTGQARTQLVQNIIGYRDLEGLAVMVPSLRSARRRALLSAVRRTQMASVAASSRIENYLGFTSGISGAELTGRAAVQAQKFGARIASPSQAARLDTTHERLRIMLTDDTTIEARAMVIATGARYRSLPLDRWAEFEGAGIYFAATELEARACGPGPGRGRRRGELRRPGGAVSRRTRQRRHPDRARQ